MTRAIELTHSVIDYDTALAEGKQLVAKLDAALAGKMRLGELADEIGRGYGDDRLRHFAKEIGIAACTLARCRSVFRAWKGAPAPKSFAVAQELQAHPNRVQIIERDPDISKRKARQFRRRLDRENRLAPDHLREETKRWFRAVIQRAGETIRSAHVADGVVEPGLRQLTREVVEPRLLPTLRDAAEALVRLAEYLENLTQEADLPEQVTLEPAE
jgi:hypothetical protein